MQAGERCFPLSRDEIVFCNSEGDIPLIGLCFLENLCNCQCLRYASLGGIEVNHVPEERDILRRRSDRIRDGRVDITRAPQDHEALKDRR